MRLSTKDQLQLPYVKNSLMTALSTTHMSSNTNKETLLAPLPPSLLGSAPSRLACFMSDIVTIEEEIRHSSTSSRQRVATDRVWSMDELQSEVAIAVAKVVSVDGVNSNDHHKSLLDMGLDSLGTTELASILQTMFDVELPSTLVFNYPTIADLSNYLHGILAPEQDSNVTSSSALSKQESSVGFSIVGMSCRFPGGVSSPL